MKRVGAARQAQDWDCFVTPYSSNRSTVTLDKEGSTLVFRGVPALICSNCGEEYVDGDITASLLESAAEAARSGIEVEVRQYSAA